jgi:ADP-ribose pyrophosphatase YjhB (NUDIX family)
MYTPPKHIVSATTIVLNNKGEILLIIGPKRGWEIPGGQVEEGNHLKIWYQRGKGRNGTSCNKSLKDFSMN